MKEILPTEPVASEVQQAPAKSTKEQHQNQIADAQRDYLLAKGNLDNVTAAIQKEREKMRELATVEELEEKLAGARKALALAEKNNSVINGLKDDRAIKQLSAKAAALEVSNLLVRFMAKYEQRSISLRTDYRQIDVTAKVGKQLDKQEVLPL